MKLWFDGSITENPGGQMGYGFIAETADSYMAFSNKVGYWEHKGPKTNNVAEYFGLIYALDYAHLEDCKEIEVYGDSKLVIEQSNGNWKVKEPHLKILCKDVRDRMEMFEKVELKWIPRFANGEADKMAKKAINNRDGE